MTPDPTLLARFGATEAAFVAETATARVWKVALADGRHAALKHYPRGMRNEATGAAFLRSADGRGAARLYDEGPDVLVTEWLDGPSLGDLSRTGEDERSAQELASVAAEIHASPLAFSQDLPQLDGWFAALFTLRITPACPAAARANIARAQAIARDLLATQTDIRPLHGDLHHDNIRHGARGWLAFDPKGILGERAFEFANAFRNPTGAPDLVRSPERIARLADLWSASFGVPRDRLLAWAAAKCALSIAWRANGQLTDDPDLDLLPLLLVAA